MDSFHELSHTHYALVFLDMDWRQPLEIELIFDEWSHTHYAVTIIWHAAPSKNLEGGGALVMWWA